jgi:hypothetical protein
MRCCRSTPARASPRSSAWTSTTFSSPPQREPAHPGQRRPGSPRPIHAPGGPDRLAPPTPATPAEPRGGLPAPPPVRQCLHYLWDVLTPRPHERDECEHRQREDDQAPHQCHEWGHHGPPYYLAVCARPRLRKTASAVLTQTMSPLRWPSWLRCAALIQHSLARKSQIPSLCAGTSRRDGRSDSSLAVSQGSVVLS